MFLDKGVGGQGTRIELCSRLASNCDEKADEIIGCGDSCAQYHINTYGFWTQLETSALYSASNHMRPCQKEVQKKNAINKKAIKSKGKL